MWKSWGDKYEIISYKEEKRPRKIKKVGIYIATSAILYILSLGLITIHIKPADPFYYYIPSSIAFLSVIMGVGLFILKWKKNNHECDLALILSVALFACMAYIALPSTTF